MKKLNALILLVGIILVSYNATAQNTKKVAVEKSNIHWEASRVGSSHDGNISISEGNIVVNDNKIVRGDFTLDMKSIVVLDIKSKGKNRKLVKHLESKDFFDVKNHTTGKYVITGSEAKDGKTLIKGKLTLKGITNDVNFLAMISTENGAVSFTSEEFTIDRTKWNIKYRSGSFFNNLKNKLIYDEIKIKVTVKAN